MGGGRSGSLGDLIDDELLGAFSKDARGEVTVAPVRHDHHDRRVLQRARPLREEIHEIPFHNQTGRNSRQKGNRMVEREKDKDVIRR